MTFNRNESFKLEAQYDACSELPTENVLSIAATNNLFILQNMIASKPFKF